MEDELAVGDMVSEIAWSVLSISDLDNGELDQDEPFEVTRGAILTALKDAYFAGKVSQ